MSATKNVSYCIIAELACTHEVITDILLNVYLLLASAVSPHQPTLSVT